MDQSAIVIAALALVVGQAVGALFLFIEWRIRRGAKTQRNPSQFTPTHRHEDESFYLLQGTLMIQAAGWNSQPSSGNLLPLPGLTLHALSNKGGMHQEILD